MSRAELSRLGSPVNPDFERMLRRMSRSFKEHIKPVLLSKRHFRDKRELGVLKARRSKAQQK